MKVLNLYAGIGGNRALWNDCEVTALEINDKWAAMYQERFPNDNVIVADAHKYLEDNYKEFDFIWASPPCQTHSRANYFIKATSKARFPDMKLWQEIIFLQSFFDGKWVVENVISHYEPLIKPTKIGRHYFWSNFKIEAIDQPKDDIGKMCGKNQKASKKHITERNAVNSELGLHIFNAAKGIITQRKQKTGELF